MKEDLKPEIRKWLEQNPLTENQELDVHGVPLSLFDLTEADERIRQLNRQIKSLPLQQQKVLLYLSRDIDPALIIESMEYTSPELFWLDKALLIKEIDPTARKNDVLQVFAVNEALVELIIEVSEEMDAESAKKKNRKYRTWSLMAIPVVVLLLALFVYPLIIKPNPVALYEKFKNNYRQDLEVIDTTSYSGGAFYEARMLMEEGNFNESARLFEEIIPSDSLYRVRSRWYLALISLRNGNRESCLEQLKAIQADDPSFYKKFAEKLFRKLRS
ncbi:MAG: hypothetical protein WC699_11635 [Bacteroidales bacterium]